MITALIGADGSARLVVDGIATKLSGESVDAVRARVVEAAMQHARATESTQRLDTEDPDGFFTVWVSPEGTVSDTPNPVPDELQTEEPADLPGPADTAAREDDSDASETAPEPVPILEAVPAARVPHPPLKRRTWAMIAAAGVVGCLLTYGGGYAAVTTWAAPTQAAPASVSSGITAPEWAHTTSWSKNLRVQDATLSSDGSTVGVVSRGTAVVLDLATGRELATQKLGKEAPARIYRAGAWLVAVDHGSAYLFKAGGAAWKPVALDGATLQVRGTAIFLARAVGSQYEIVGTDGTPDPIPVPTAGAVPVGAHNQNVVWASAANTVYVTDRAGTVQHQARIAPPTAGAKASWLGSDPAHVFIAWAAGDETTLTVADLTTGRIVASQTLPLGVPSRSAEWTRDGDQTVIADLVIDTSGDLTVSAVDELGASGARVAGDSITAAGDSGDVLVGSGGKLRRVTDSNTRVLATAPAGILTSRDGQMLFAATKTNPQKG